MSFFEGFCEDFCKTEAGQTFRGRAAFLFVGTALRPPRLVVPIGVKIEPLVGGRSLPNQFAGS